MKPFHKTLIMGLLAMLLGSTAAYFYPWPEAETAEGESVQLFDEFKKQVWSINIVRYDRETETLKAFSLRRKGQRWTVPTKFDFVATGQRIALAASCLNEKVILQEQSEDQQDQTKFGVVDPIEFQSATNRDAIGTKISLEDVNRNPLGSLIIGSRVKDSRNQYYVRKPGQPKVYVIEFDPSVLTTELRDWIEPNFLDLNDNQKRDGADLAKITVQNYRLSGDKLQTAEKSFIYRGILLPFEQNIKKRVSVEIPNGDEWERTDSSATQFQELAPAGAALYNLELIDVLPKEAKLAKKLNEGVNKLKANDFKAANPFGFRAIRDGDSLSLDGSGGSVVIVTDDGIETQLLIGNPAVTNEVAADKLNYYMMVVARVADELTKEPIPPQPAEGSELTDDQKKEFARAKEAWEKKLNAAQLLSTEINRIHAGWYYIVSEGFANGLRPAVTGLKLKKVDDEAEDAKSAEGEDKKKEDGDE